MARNVHISTKEGPPSLILWKIQLPRPLKYPSSQSEEWICPTFDLVNIYILVHCNETGARPLNRSPQSLNSTLFGVTSEIVAKDADTPLIRRKSTLFEDLTQTDIFHFKVSPLDFPIISSSPPHFTCGWKSIPSLLVFSDLAFTLCLMPVAT
jgi:hypothetical protein